jgi:hypothetical protein
MHSIRKANNSVHFAPIASRKAYTQLKEGKHKSAMQHEQLSDDISLGAVEDGIGKLLTALYREETFDP